MISILLSDLRGGGAERVCLDLAYEFKKRGFDVEIVLLNEQGSFLEEAKNNFTVIDLCVSRVRAAPIDLYKYLHNNKPDVLLIAMWPLTAIGSIVSRLASSRTKVIITEHGILSAQYKSWGKLHHIMLRISTAIGYRLSNHRVGVSKGVANDMASLSRLGTKKFVTIYNPIPKKSIADQQTRNTVNGLWSEDYRKRVLAVGTMKAVKNYPLLLKSFLNVKDENTQLMFVGDGDGRDELEQLAIDLGVADRVLFAGFQPDPTPFYETADLFVLSSNYEGFGNVIVEALAAGTPVVSTDCPSGPAEILENGKYGKLVPVGDVDAMASAIDEALNQEVDKEFLKKRAAYFSPERAADAYLSLLGLQ